MQSYGQFCPIAKALEVIGTRWTGLVLRELMSGANRFNELQRGVPLMSRALLAQRLRELEAAGLVQSEGKQSGPGREYMLTEAGLALRPVIAALGVWGQQHTKAQLTHDDCDPTMWFWAVSRYADPANLPDKRFVAQFTLRNLPRGRRAAGNWWVVADPDEPMDVCLKDPGFAVDVQVNADNKSLVEVWLGYRGLREASQNGDIEIEGTSAARAALRRLLDLRDTPQQKPFFN